MDKHLELGNLHIDSQHRGLYRAVQRLAALEDSPSNAEQISDQINQFSILLRMHFADEEAIMVRLGVPEDVRQAHIKAHFEIVEEITMVHLNTMIGRRPGLQDLSEQIARWVIDHIVDFDLQLKPYVSPT